jgi:hypothetical protein
VASAADITLDWLAGLCRYQSLSGMEVLADTIEQLLLAALHMYKVRPQHHVVPA